MSSESFAIAQVTPYAWEDDNEVNSFVRECGARLAARGHKLLVLAPSRAPDAVRGSRRLLRSAREHPERLFDAGGGVRVLSVGEVLTLAPSRRASSPSVPVDVSRTIEQTLNVAPLDFVHVHEPFAPSASSVALRHSRALNVGTFHLPTERVLSTQVARRFVELFFGRLDARAATYATTADLLRASFPADYTVVAGGVELAAPRPRAESGAGLHIVFCAHEERAALRLFLRALRSLVAEPAWRATIYVPAGVLPVAPVGGRLRERVRVVSAGEASEADILASADVVVAASVGATPAPGLLLRAIGARAIPVAANVGPYENVLGDGELGLLFERGDVDTLCALLARLLRDEPLRGRLLEHAEAGRARLSWERVADDYERIFRALAARRRPEPQEGRGGVRLRRHKLIDVDLHMHTDHSHDCATPVEVLLGTAREQRLGAIAVTDHNEVSGAFAAAELADDFGLKVIVGEEVKTADQGEVIGLFIQEKIPRGMSLKETVADIKRQGGLVYVPHPFDRLHSVPDYEHLLTILDDIDLLEVFNPRVALREFNEEAVRFAGKYRIPAGAGSDSHVPQGLGSVRVRMRDFEGPQEFLASLRDADIIGTYSSLGYVQVQAIKFLQTRATPAPARRVARERKVRKAIEGAERNR